MSYINVSAEQERIWEKEKIECFARFICRKPTREERRQWVEKQRRLHGDRTAERIKQEVLRQWDLMKAENQEAG